MVNRFDVAISQAQCGITSAIVQVSANSDRYRLLFSIVFGGLSPISINLHAGEVFLGNDIDNTSKRVGAVGRASTTRQNVYALHHRHWDVIEVKTTVQLRRRVANAVNQNYVTVTTEASEVDVGKTAVAVVDVRPNAGNNARDFP